MGSRRQKVKPTPMEALKQATAHPSEGKSQFVPLKDITFDQQLQIRSDGLNEAHVARLVTVLQEGGEFDDPIDVFRLPDGRMVATNGFHRGAAKERAGHETIEAVIHEGSWDDARRHAAQANIRNDYGLALSNDSKKNVLKTMMELGDWLDWSDGYIAVKLGVKSSATIGYWMDELFKIEELKVQRPTKRLGADGKYREVKEIAEAARQMQAGKAAAAAQEDEYPADFSMEDEYQRQFDSDSNPPDDYDPRTDPSIFPDGIDQEQEDEYPAEEAAANIQTDLKALRVRAKILHAAKMKWIDDAQADLRLWDEVTDDPADTRIQEVASRRIVGGPQQRPVDEQRPPYRFGIGDRVYSASTKEVGEVVSITWGGEQWVYGVRFKAHSGNFVAAGIVHEKDMPAGQRADKGPWLKWGMDQEDWELSDQERPRRNPLFEIGNMVKPNGNQAYRSVQERKWSSKRNTWLYMVADGQDSVYPQDHLTLSPRSGTNAIPKWELSKVIGTVLNQRWSQHGEGSLPAVYQVHHFKNTSGGNDCYVGYNAKGKPAYCQSLAGRTWYPAEVGFWAEGAVAQMLPFDEAAADADTAAPRRLRLAINAVGNARQRLDSLRGEITHMRTFLQGGEMARILDFDQYDPLSKLADDWLSCIKDLRALVDMLDEAGVEVLDPRMGELMPPRKD